MLDQNSSRMIAETLWGRGDTRAERCNHVAAHWFSCAEHGGLILDLGQIETRYREEIVGFAPVRRGHVLLESGRPVRAGVGEALFKSRNWEEVVVEFMAFERDRDWCLPMALLGIGRFSDMTDMFRIDQAQKLFKRYHDPMNPDVMARRVVEVMANSRDSDVIVAGVRVSHDQCRVYTADGGQSLVEGYEAAIDNMGVRRISLCSHAVMLDADGKSRQESESAVSMALDT
ncbi:hypothetical protein ACEUZ9_001128 [Paracoccus litorisediminis]